MDDLRVLQEMRADAPEPGEARLAEMRAALSEEITLSGLTAGTPPREALAAGALATQGAVRGTAARRVPRFVKLGVALSGVAAAALAALLVNGGAAPAFAVTSQADGSIKVTINEFSDPGSLEEALADKGVNAAVDYLPEGKTCQGTRGEPAKASGRVETGLRSNGGGVDFTITKGAVGSGETLVLAISGGGSGKAPSGMNVAVIKGEVKECTPVSVPAPADSGEGEKGPKVNERFEQGGPEKGTRNVTEGDGQGPRHDTGGSSDDGSKILHHSGD
ncbi:hypothetical protein [Nonomuraea ferruginea]|uniref:DUF5667 domain-containing protein n=1 Tax=Nonomuraea ferruginea TaxID=46174 RepID=A0ABT4TC37_9ACTN|nr:hypothetical protein [Nonomuraea ferruginea]MDA0647071.1 hypothetical protein [Nonomuraea ferruginea]